MRGLCLLASVLIFLFSGCVEVHRNIANQKVVESAGYISGGKQKSPNNKARLSISCHEINSFSDWRFGAVSCVFENNSVYWARLDDVAIDFDSDLLNQNVLIPVGADLRSWALGIRNQKSLDKYSADITNEAIALSGTSLVIGSKKSSVRSLGTIGVLGSGIFLTARDIRQRRIRLQSSAVLPSNHLLSRHLIIPPGMFIRRWILFYTPEADKLPVIYSMNISFNDGGKGMIREKMIFRQKKQWTPLSRWQYEERKKKVEPAEEEIIRFPKLFWDE